jgi:uncharacterized protein YfaS (alpha-2-macroglobulin family)
MKSYTGPQAWIDSLEWPKQKKMDMRSGIWNERRLYRAGEIAKYSMNLREIGWGGMDWIDLAQNRGQGRVPVNMETNFWVS